MRPPVKIINCHNSQNVGMKLHSVLSNAFRRFVKIAFAELELTDLDPYVALSLLAEMSQEVAKHNVWKEEY